MFFAVNLILLGGLQLLLAWGQGGQIGSDSRASAPVAALFGVFALASIVPMLAILVRRLHDTGRTGWWSLLWVVPIVNLLLLVLCAAGSAFG